MIIVSFFVYERIICLYMEMYIYTNFYVICRKCNTSLSFHVLTLSLDTHF